VSAIDDVLAQLRRELWPTGHRARRRALEEARDHLLSFVEDAVDAGCTPVEAERLAVECFGRPEDVAAVLIAARRRRGRLLPAVALAGSLAGVLAVAPVQLGRELGHPSVAGAAPMPTERDCAAAWNAPAASGWRALARAMHAHRANVAIGVAIRKTGQVVFVRCTVELWLPWRPGSYQHGIAITARWTGAGRTLAFQPRPFRSAGPRQHANGLIQADGSLRYFTFPVPDPVDRQGRLLQVASVSQRPGLQTGWPVRLTLTRKALVTVDGPLPQHNTWRVQLIRVGSRWFGSFTAPLPGRYGVSIDGRRREVLPVRGQLATRRAPAPRYVHNRDGSWSLEGSGVRVYWRRHRIAISSRHERPVVVGAMPARFRTLRVVPRFGDRAPILLLPNTGPIVAPGRRLYLLRLPGGVLRVDGLR
jgi:hypothetical protein